MERRPSRRKHATVSFLLQFCNRFQMLHHEIVLAFQFHAKMTILENMYSIRLLFPKAIGFSYHSLYNIILVYVL